MAIKIYIKLKIFNLCSKNIPTLLYFDKNFNSENMALFLKRRHNGDGPKACGFWRLNFWNFPRFHYPKLTILKALYGKWMERAKLGGGCCVGCGKASPTRGKAPIRFPVYKVWKTHATMRIMSCRFYVYISCVFPPTWKHIIMDRGLILWPMLVCVHWRFCHEWKYNAAKVIEQLKWKV